MTLDHFESALLTELRSHVGEGRTPQRRHRRRWALAGVPVVAAGAVAAGLALAPASSAYTVHKAGNGDIVVTIKRLDNAHGLERALQADGVTADVDYSARPQQPAGQSKDCAPAGWSGAGGKIRIGDRVSISSDGAFTLHLPADAATGGRVLHLTGDGSAAGSHSPASLRVAWSC